MYSSVKLIVAVVIFSLGTGALPSRRESLRSGDTGTLAARAMRERLDASEKKVAFDAMMLSRQAIQSTSPIATNGIGDPFVSWLAAHFIREASDQALFVKGVNGISLRVDNAHQDPLFVYFAQVGIAVPEMGYRLRGPWRLWSKGHPEDFPVSNLADNDFATIEIYRTPKSMSLQDPLLLINNDTAKLVLRIPVPVSSRQTVP
jgi:hypothetical protein